MEDDGGDAREEDGGDTMEDDGGDTGESVTVVTQGGNKVESDDTCKCK